MTNSRYFKRINNYVTSPGKKTLIKRQNLITMEFFFSDDVSKTCREIRATLNQKKKEMKEKGFIAWIPPTVPPTLCYIDQDGVKQKKKWYNVPPVE